MKSIKSVLVTVTKDNTILMLNNQMGGLLVRLLLIIN